MILSIRLIDSLFLAWIAFVERHADQHGSGAAPLVGPAFEIGDDGAAGIVRAHLVRPADRATTADEAVLADAIDHADDIGGAGQRIFGRLVAAFGEQRRAAFEHEGLGRGGCGGGGGHSDSEEEQAHQNPMLAVAVGKDSKLKEMLVEYVGTKLNKEEVTVHMIIEVMATEFPEFVFAFAEENFLRGYQLGLDDADKLRTEITEQTTRNSE